MQLVEYVNSLFEQGLSGEEVIAKTQEWKKKNNYGVSEEPSVLKEDLKPKEDLLFTITFFPLTQYEQKIDR